MSDYKITIGLEIHAELKTNSKMFCGCKNDPYERKPNINICPICMGNPGTLPVINKEAVRKVLLVGKALNGQLADFTEFDRKNYFYPDIPKGYQISQYKYPLVSGGELNGVKLTRIHLEEDTARSSHDSSDYSLVDYNRAGLPLMELVTEPCLHSAKEVGDFGRELQLLLQYLDVSDANMEEGQMRVEVNISVSNTEKFGTKVEIKNINSFRSAERAVEYEFKRQVGLLEKGEKVLQETRGFDENKGTTFSQRSKENANDYRYFPDPDLPKIFIKELFDFEKGLILPETPNQKRKRFTDIFGIKESDIEVYINNKNISDLFEKSITFLQGSEQFQLLSNYITSDIMGIIKTKTEDEVSAILNNLKPEYLSKIVLMIVDGKISSRGAKDIIKFMIETNEDPLTIAEQKNLIQKNDPEELKKILTKIIADNQDLVDDYKKGKATSLQFFIGQAMKESKGSANPVMLQNILKELLS
jgi:aspartyl-tRNA(Asn)/glutamyl-tRNA(Gln) amidotransferase subunit B